MTTRTDLSVDSRGRISVTKLGFEASSTLVAESLPDGSVVLRKARVLTEAEIDILRNPSAMADIHRGLADIDEGNIVAPRRSTSPDVPS
ncbi:MAG: hypothetical protein U9R51_08655 [Actinomycetota bacterium]|nr:hypothetical protein [Actinomycetota bacterium]